MGWLFIHGSSKSDIVNRLTAAEENETRRWEPLAHSIRGNVLWAVVELTKKQEQSCECFIACYLLQSSRDSGWGYKEMTESMYPSYFSCPLKFLKMAPEASPAWRDGVREYHQRRNRKVEVGQKISLTNASIPCVIITSQKPLLGVHDGVNYRVPRRMLGDVI